MTEEEQQQQQRPRIILEKSRTVRRRYQRSNQRFQFTASQIRRIEREEEREKKARQLREREKRRIANKKKKAEKEAKEREERRRLGLPDPNAPKVSASQPSLVKFFGRGGAALTAVSKSKAVEGRTIGQSEVDFAATTTTTASDTETEVDDEWFKDALSEQSAL